LAAFAIQISGTAADASTAGWGWRVACKGAAMLIHVVLVLVVVGVLLWLIESFVPMDAKILRLLQAVVVIVMVIWLLRVFGIINILPGLNF
jgi:cytochrome c biogenesis protein CcdA